MSIIAQNTDKEVAILDCVHRFFSKHHMGELLKKCNGTKEKGVPAISLLRYRLENVFADRSMYMQMRTGSFKENFSKNTVYRFLNSAKTNWLKFTTALPVNSCLMASSKESNIIGPQKDFDKRSIAGKRRKLAQMKATDTMLQLLDMATAQGITADYVLFDSWFSNPAQLTAIKSRGMDVIAVVKKSSRINYEYEGEKLNIKQIYAKNKKHRGKSKYLLSVSVMLV